MFPLKNSTNKSSNSLSLLINRDQPMVLNKLQAPASSPEMDPGIWSRMPEELLEYILSLLPLKIFMKLRSTCKHFKSLIYSPSFVNKHSSSSSSFSSFLLLSHPQFSHNFPLYDSMLGSWRVWALSMPFMLPCSGGVRSGSPSCSLLSTSNGLLCFSLPNSCSFLVCNFLAKTSRVIEMPVYPLAFESLTFVSTPLGYKIFIMCSNYSSKCAFVYDSRVHSWQRFDGCEPILTNNCPQKGVFFKSFLYFAIPEPFSIVSFDMETGKWQRLSGELPTELIFARLVSDGEKNLYLVGGIGRNGISRSIKLWELGGEGNWIEVETLPEMICRKFVSVCYHNYEHVYCFWHQGMICVCCYTWPEILYCKVSRRTWHWLPKCPSLPEKWSCGFSESPTLENSKIGDIYIRSNIQRSNFFV